MISGKPTLESMSIATSYNQWTFNLFKKYLKGEILEVGCGIGNFTGYLAQHGSVTAIDIEQEYIINLSKEKKANITYKIADISSKKFSIGKKFNAIVCINVLEHIKDHKTALENISSALKEDGYLILLVPAHQFLYGEIDKNIDHFRRYDKKQLQNLLINAQFNIRNIRKLNLLGAIGWFITGKVLKEKDVDENKIKLFDLVSPPFLFFEKIIEPLIGTSLLAIATKKL
ncbi:class I SAM-dependent methyltransferase [Candidatus Daviesbacteria bacterium]|nr:class I SAM-dependent methyltransferase [Candidatus Daviesbacteria bacterium]